jgi:hypothetical protein
VVQILHLPLTPQQVVVEVTHPVQLEVLVVVDEDGVQLLQVEQATHLQLLLLKVQMVELGTAQV